MTRIVSGPNSGWAKLLRRRQVPEDELTVAGESMDICGSFAWDFHTGGEGFHEILSSLPNVTEQHDKFHPESSSAAQWPISLLTRTKDL